MRTMIIAAALGLMAGSAEAQLTGSALWADSARREIETAYRTGDAERLVRARAVVDRALTRFPDDALLLHYRGYAYYREANLRMGGGLENDMDALLDGARQSLERSARSGAIAETQALLAAVIGQKIGSSPLKGMVLGPESDEWMDAAMRSNPHNPRVWLLRGIGAIFKPKMFGGGLERAESDLRKAIALFESDKPSPPAPAWGEGEAWIWLGQALERGERKEEARQAYRKALELEPDNGWVKDVLLPGLDKKGT